MNKNPYLSKYSALGKKVFDDEIHSLETVKTRINESFDSCVSIIKMKVPPGKVVVMGVGKSGHIGKKIAASLASTGTPSFFVHAAEAGHGDLGMITKDDVVLAISYSGSSSEFETVIAYLKRNAICLISMTKNSPSLLFDASDISLDITITKEACPLGLAPSASSTSALVMGDALALSIMQARGFGKEDYAQTHPHGALGRKLLLSVEDIMAKDENLPILKENETIKESILKISKYGLGIGVIIDENFTPVGVFTDGDIRRTLENEVDLANTIITEVMSTQFHKIFLDKLALEVVSLMEDKEIDSVPVIDGKGYLLGVVTLKDILKSGII